MKTIYLVMGASNSGKSSIVRCLSGCRDSKDNWKIKTIAASSNNFYVNVTSPQEKDGIGISPKEFVKQLENVSADNILSALQSKSSSSQPYGSEYIKEFIKKGWVIKPIVLLGENADTFGLPSKVFSNINSKITNEIAAGARSYLGII